MLMQSTYNNENETLTTEKYSETEAKNCVVEEWAIRHFITC